ncbi:MAG TPA: phosphatidylglycerophosphatase A [Methylomirabilota bacterium]|jgi:phosphatidylglycerophosphatase A|nr:phosphatidylglycerophosphatase A [Methylomirabilota bacterium]
MPDALAPASGRRRPLTAANRIALFVATAGGAGYAPIAPGTVGSALAALLLWLIPFSREGLVLFLLAVTVGGAWAAHRAEQLLGARDPGAIVIDEVAGMTLSVLAFPLTPPVLAVGLLLFRLFDILKPFPARVSQKLHGGAGVMVDDLIAGLYALGALSLLRTVARWP